MGSALTAVLAFLAKSQARKVELQTAATRVEMAEKHQVLKSSLDSNTAKTESIEKAVNGNLDARIALAVTAALEKGRMEGVAIGIEQERARGDANKAATFEALLKAKKGEEGK